MSVPLLIVTIFVPILAIVAIFIILYFIHKYFPNLSKKKVKELKPCVVEFHNEGNETPYLIKKNPDGSISDEDFRVVSCADLHLATDEHVFGLTVLERLVDKVHPDLLVLVGDNACGRLDTYIEEQLIKFFERKKLHYAFVLGNHDSEPLITNEMKKHKEVNKVASTIDMIPTVYNLFGLDYDSRLIIGKDIFSSDEGLAMFADRSWVSDKGTYNVGTGRFTLAEGQTLEDENEYVKTMNNIVKNKIKISENIIKKDYYKRAWNYLKVSQTNQDITQVAE